VQLENALSHGVAIKIEVQNELDFDFSGSTESRRG
jgi:hypothetical protein